jgi:hypothetical protein
MLKKLPSKLIRKEAIAGAIILALAFGFWGLNIWDRSKEPEESNGSEDEEVVPVFQHPLSGLGALEAFEALPQVYAVMIDNSVDAWPVVGVEKAFLVIEAPVEAEIPRLEAFFSSDEAVEKIGPVRSARPYFVDWANEFDALYVHVGGSNAALDLIASTGTFDLNEFWNGAVFWRANGSRYAPHNTFTSSEALAAFVEKAKEDNRAPELVYGLWRWFEADKDGKEDGEGEEGGDVITSAVPAGGQEAKQSPDLSVRFNSDLYTVEWTYDEATGKYLRSQGREPYVVESGETVSAANVAVVLTDMKVLDYVGRRFVRTTGEGNGWLAQDGQTAEVTWKKPSASERLRFYGADGKEIEMNPGTTWVEVVGDEEDVTVQ